MINRKTLYLAIGGTLFAGLLAFSFWMEGIWRENVPNASEPRLTRDSTEEPHGPSRGLEGADVPERLLREAKAALVTLKSEKDSIAVQLSQTNTDLANARAQIDRITTDSDAALRRAQEDSNTRERELVARLGTSESEKTLLDAKLTQTKFDLEHARAEIDRITKDSDAALRRAQEDSNTRERELDARLATSESEKTALDAKLTQMKSDLEHARAEIDRITKDSDAALRRAQDDSNTRERALESRLATSESEKTALEAKLTQMKSDLEHARAEIDRTTNVGSAKPEGAQGFAEARERELEDRLATSESDKTALDAKLSQMNFDLERSRAELERVTKESGVAIRRADDSNARVRELEGRLATSESDKTSLDAKLTRATSDLENARAEIDQITKESEAALGHVNDSKTQVRELEGRLATSESEKAAVIVELSRVRDELRHESAENGEQKKENEIALGRIRDEAQIRERNLDARLIETESERTALASQLVQITTEMKTGRLVVIPASSRIPINVGPTLSLALSTNNVANPVQLVVMYRDQPATTVTGERGELLDAGDYTVRLLGPTTTGGNGYAAIVMEKN